MYWLKKHPNILLAIVSAVSSTVIIISVTLTKNRIQMNSEIALQKMLSQVFKAETYIPIKINGGQLSDKPIVTAYLVQNSTEPEGIILPVTAKGYGGPIQLLLGIKKTGEIQGVRVLLPHFETPGLGDKIELQKSKWIISFNGLTVNSLTPEQWSVNSKNSYFDSFTGATITPNAIIQSIKLSLRVFKENQQRWFNSESIQ